MKNKISRTFAISGSMVDAGNKIRPFELMKCLEFVAGEHACIMGMGIPKVVAEDSAYWVISKMAIDFLDDRPSFGEKIKIITIPTSPSLIKFDRYFWVLAKSRKIARVKSSWCIIDKASKQIRKVNTLKSCPSDLEYLDAPFDFPYAKINIADVVSTGNLAYVKTVRYSDLDINGHMNNCVYTTIMCDAISSDNFTNKHIKHLEVHFLKEVLEGEMVEVYVKDIDGDIFVVGKLANSDSVCFAGEMLFLAE